MKKEYFNRLFYLIIIMATIRKEYILHFHEKQKTITKSNNGIPETSISDLTDENIYNGCIEYRWYNFKVPNDTKITTEITEKST